MYHVTINGMKHSGVLCLAAAFFLLSSVLFIGCRANQARDENAGEDSLKEMLTRMELDSLRHHLAEQNPDYLQSRSRITILAPVDEAFVPAEGDTLAVRLAFDWQRHAISGHHYLIDLRHGTTVQTLDGMRAQVTINNEGVRIGNARIVQSDIDVHNVVMHVIDGFITSAEPLPKPPADEEEDAEGDELAGEDSDQAPS